MKKISLLTGLTILAADQITKFLALKYLADDNSLNIIGNFLRLDLVINKGSAFGLFTSYSNLILWVNSVFFVAFVLFIFIYKSESIMLSSIFGLFLGGIGGNLIDRLRVGGVVDFIDLGWWPSFNIADSAMTIGVIFLVYYLLVTKK